MINVYNILEPINTLTNQRLFEKKQKQTTHTIVLKTVKNRMSCIHHSGFP